MIKYIIYILLVSSVALGVEQHFDALQVGIKATRSTSSIADFKSTTKGFLIPRMTTAQKNAITSPTDGLLVFDTTLESMQEYNGTSSTWTNLLGAVGGVLSGNSTVITDGSGNLTTSPTTASEVAFVHTATNANTASTIVKRDGSGNFSAGTITATLTGNVTGNLTGNASGTAANVTGTVAIANGGTGQITKSTGFDALSPMTTSGDLIYGGASGTGTRLGVGSTNSVLTVSGSGLPSWGSGGGGGTGINFVGLGTGWTLTSSDDIGAEGSVGNWAAFANTASLTPGSLTGGSPSSTCARTTTAGHILDGTASFEFVKSAANRQGEGCSVLINVPPGYRGQSTQIQTPFKIISGSIAAGGSVILAAYDVTNGATIPVSGVVNTTSTLALGNMVVPASTAQMRVGWYVQGTDATAVTFAFDDVIVGPPTNTGEISQASLYGTLTYVGVASCTWTVTQTTFAADFPANASCNAATVSGNITAPTTKVPQAVLNNAPAGDYWAIATFEFLTNGSIDSQDACQIVDENGTQLAAQAQNHFVTNSSTYDGRNMFTIQGKVSYTNVGNHTFKVRCLNSNNNAAVINGGATVAANKDLNISVLYFPNSTQRVARADQLANFWSGYHDNDCTWSRTSATLGDPAIDSSCTFTQKTNTNFGTVTSYNDGTAGNNLPGLTWTPTSPGTYLIMATIEANGASAATNGLSYFLWDGTTEIAYVRKDIAVTNNVEQVPLIGLYDVTSTSQRSIRIQMKNGAGNNVAINTSDTIARAINWSIIKISGNVPYPNLINSVVSSSVGVEGIHRATFVGSSGTITRQDGSWLSSITRNAAGDYTLNIAASVFSAAPTCTCNMDNNNGTNAHSCVFRNDLTAMSATAMRFTTIYSGATADGNNVHVICMGPK